MPNPMIILSNCDCFLNNKFVNEYPEKYSKMKGNNSLDMNDLGLINKGI